MGHFKASKLCKGNSYGSQSRRRVRTSARGTPYRGRGRGIRRRVYCTDAVEDNGLGEMFEQSASVADVFVATSDASENKEWTVAFNVGDKQLPLEIDSGAMCNVLSKQTAEKFTSMAPIVKSDTIINGVSGKQTKAHGKIVLPCEYKGKQSHIEFHVMDTPREINLLGRDDSVKLGLIVRVNIAKVSIDEIIKEYSDVLGDEIGCLPEEYEIKIDETVEPVIHAPRPVPAAIWEQLKKDLEHLEKCGIIAVQTEPTDWVNSLVCVRKKNDRIRFCIDPTDLNVAIRREHYPMNSFDDVSTRLHGSKYFTKLDANMGYYQIKLTEKSPKLTTFNTPFGRFRFLRMPMGIKCSSEVYDKLYWRV